MATITTDLICNLNQPVAATFLHGNLFSQDNAGNTINVHVMDNGEPATIGGTVSANVIRADGNTVAVSGSMSGNQCSVVLPQACYAVPGRVEIIIKLTQSTTITTIAAIVANVYRSTTDTVVDPGTIIPSIQALIEEIEDAVDSIPVDYSGLLATIAADYSSSKTYQVGQYAWQGGVLKRCIVPITTAETYTAAHWTNAVIGDDLSALKSALDYQSVTDWNELRPTTTANKRIYGNSYSENVENAPITDSVAIAFLGFVDGNKDAGAQFVSVVYPTKYARENLTFRRTYYGQTWTEWEKVSYALDYENVTNWNDLRPMGDFQRVYGYSVGVNVPNAPISSENSVTLVGFTDGNVYGGVQTVMVSKPYDASKVSVYMRAYSGNSETSTWGVWQLLATASDLSSAVTSLQQSINTKANQTDLAALSNTVSGNTSSIESLQTNKANQTDLDSAENDITALQQGKADKTELADVESDIYALQQGKANESDLDSVRENKANRSEVNALNQSKINKPQTSPNGTNGQILRTLGNGETEWVSYGLPSSQQTDEAVKKWLNEHPEATTTVDFETVAKVFETVSNMVEDETLTSGDKVATIGYNSISDNGGANYVIEENGVADGGKIIALTNGLFAVCVSENVPYSNYILNGKTATVYNLTANADIASTVNGILSDSGITEVRLPNGNYTVSAVINVPENKTLRMEGDYLIASERKTVISPSITGIACFKLNSHSVLTGGEINLDDYENTTGIYIDCHNIGIERVCVKGTKIYGGRESDGVLSQNGIYIDCDPPTGTEPSSGYLVHCNFDAYIENVGYGYQFVRNVSTASTSGVWLTANNIYGYIRHCSRYIYFDFASGSYANNGSVIAAELQAGSLITGETNYPGMNIFGLDILITGKLWDFSSPRQNPGVRFESSAQRCVVFHDTSVYDVATANGGISLNSTFKAWQRFTSYKKVNVTANASAISNGYISDFTDNSYRIGDILYLNLKFKIPTTAPAYTALFSIDDDAFVSNFNVRCVKESDGSVVCNVYVPSANPHSSYIKASATGSNAWIVATAELVSNRIKTAWNN